MSATFDVSDVGVADPIPTEHFDGFLTAAADLLHPGPPWEDAFSWEGVLQGWSCGCEAVMSCQGSNALVITALTAFARHSPLSISPDHVWTTLLQGLAHHINDDPEARRHLVVSHEGKLELSVRRDDFTLGDLGNDWAGVVAEFEKQIAEHLVSPANLTPTFSTTGPIEAFASRAAIMDMASSFFDYELLTICGIPHVTLEGTPEDWSALRLHAEALSDYGLEPWLTALRPILRELESAAHGDHDRRFWRSMVKHDDRSGGPYVSGWLLDLFPYLKDASADLLAPNTGLGDRSRELSLSQVPRGLSRADIDWKYLGQKIPIEVVSGFFGYSQDGATLRPELGWIIQRKDLAKK